MSGVLQFDSALLPPDERFARYRALYAEGTDAVQTGPDFAVRVTAWRLDGIGVFDRRLHHVGHVRGPDRAGDDGFDHIVVMLVRQGRVEVDTGGGDHVVAAGGGVIADTQRPWRNRMYDARILTVRIARDRFPVAVDGGVLHGRILSPDRTALLIDFVDALTRRLDAMPDDAAGFATEALLALVAGAIGAGAGGEGDTPALRRDTARIARVHALIDAALADPDLDPATIVARSGWSRATLYRLFRARGGLAAEIAAWRLDRLQAMLNDGDDRRPFAELALACGFRSEGHASRLFRHRFGTRPGRYRRDWNEGGDPGLPLREMRYLDAAMR